MSRQRKAVAVLCIALVFCAALFPGGAPEILWTALTPLWLIAPAADVTLVARIASRCDGQPTALLSLVLLRAPPSRLSLA